MDINSIIGIIIGILTLLGAIKIKKYKNKNVIVGKKLKNVNQNISNINKEK